jgi:phenylpropionate dioxygenase-like ring-hydroxylating dioxygenase large terminal subunit
MPQVSEKDAKMPFARNQWYAASWSDQLGRQIVARKILGEEVILFRDDELVAVATGGVCPHRFAPLHLGQIVEGTIECPYHGLRFDSTGRCVFNPDGGHLPRGAKLRVYPVLERWGCVWIWPGDPDRADESLLPNFSFLSDPGRYQPVTGMLNVRANYQLCLDNVLDAAHVRMVHSASLYCDKLSDAKTVLVRDDQGGIWANRLVEATSPPPVFDMMWRSARGDYQGLMDHWVEAGWFAPSLVANRIGVALHGQARAEGIETRASHFFTPETETSTHYFWSICRDFDLSDPDLDAAIRVATEKAFVEEDEVMLRAVQECMGDRSFWEMQPALVPADVGSIEARRALDRLIAAEASETKSKVAASTVAA